MEDKGLTRNGGNWQFQQVHLSRLNTSFFTSSCHTLNMGNRPLLTLTLYQYVTK